MTKRCVVALGSLLALSFVASPSLGEEFLLYAPQPATGQQPPATPDQGVLVRTVTVKPGDTLAKLSKKHIGREGWFPQILVFNSVKNPDLIQVGQKLRIPVRAGREALGAGKGKRPQSAKRISVDAKPSSGKLTGEEQVAATGEGEAFLKAKQAYLERDYPKALSRFSGFISKYPHSKFAADASLYRADCFLRLSGE